MIPTKTADCKSECISRYKSYLIIAWSTYLYIRFRICLATLRHYRLVDRYFATHPRINTELFSTLNVFTVVSKTNDVRQRDFSFISSYVQRVAFHGPIFDWGMDWGKYATLLQTRGLLYLPPTAEVPGRKQLKKVEECGRAIQAKFKNGGFCKAWTSILRTLNQTVEIELRFLLYSGDYGRIVHVLRRYYPNVEVALTYRNRSNHRRLAAPVNELLYKTVQRALERANTSPTQLLIEGLVQEFIIGRCVQQPIPVHHVARLIFLQGMHRLFTSDI